MGWLRNRGDEGRDRAGRAETASGSAGSGRNRARETAGSAAPGLASLFEGLKRDAGHVILDMGVATSDSLNLYRPFARTVRFAGLHPRPPHGPDLEEALTKVPPPAGNPYDTLLLWDVVDRLLPEERLFFVEKLSGMSRTGARLHTIVDGSPGTTKRPVRIELAALDRIRTEAVGAAAPSGPPLLPAELERLLRPFEVIRGFTLRSGLREYVAVKR